MKKIIFALFLIGCSPKIVPHVTTETKDSIVYQTKDRPVYIPGETVTRYDTIKCPDGSIPVDFKNQTTKGKATIKTKLKNGRLTSICKCDSLLAHMTDSITRFYRSKETTTVLPPKIEYRTTNIDLFCRWFTGLVLAFLSGYAFFKFKPDLIGVLKKLLP